MTVHELVGRPPAWLGEALAHFERQFSYPLGPERSFRITHGQDYSTFFRAMGEAHVFVAERVGTVFGTLAAVVRSVRCPNGEVRTAAYLCDLKVAPHARGGRTLPLLMKTVRDRLAERCGGLGYGVVMSGTAHTPEAYTGQVDIPAFAKLHELTVLRASTEKAVPPEDPVRTCTGSVHEEIFQRLAAAEYMPLGGDPSRRSQTEPTYLQLADGSACGVLEDTRLGKQLFDDAGKEMVSAHLSRFAYGTVADGARLLSGVLGLARERGFPAVFTAIPQSAAREMMSCLKLPDTLLAPAAVYGCGFQRGGRWQIDTAEI